MSLMEGPVVSGGPRMDSTLDLGYARVEEDMRVFVSGQIDEKRRVREVYRALAEAGWQVTHDWTTAEGLTDVKEQRADAAKRAELDITGVVNADVYVLLSDNVNVGKGMYAELGAALALREATGKPEVYVVGPMNHMSVFYLHPSVRHRATIEEVVKDFLQPQPNT